MTTRAILKRGAYRDSIELMRITLELEAVAGVQQASVMMGTPSNLQLLADADLMDVTLEQAGPNDLIIVVRAETADAADSAVQVAEALLQPTGPSSGGQLAERRPRSIEAATQSAPNASLLLVSTPGAYAAAEALKGLKRGLNVFLFSDNVPLQQEIVLKTEAESRGLLVMGPDCGTAMLGGAPLGFANVVRPGAIGLVGPSGTGIQQVACLIDRLGAGISHAIGTGSHDLSTEVGGISAARAIRALNADPATRVIVVIAKPSAPGEAQRLIDLAPDLQTPMVVCFLGLAPEQLNTAAVTVAHTLEEAARLAVALDRGSDVPSVDDPTIDARAMRYSLAPGQRDIRGLFSGGTLCAEAAMVLVESGLEVTANVSLPGVRPPADIAASSGHTCIDLGADELTVGRPHPMIDARTRLDRILQEAGDPATAVILLDVVLGHGANPDPAGELVPAIERAQAIAAEASRAIQVVASVCGTEGDPQKLSHQEQLLRESGVSVVTSNVAAARLAAQIVGAEAPPAGLPAVRRLAAGRAGTRSPVALTESLLQRPAHVVSVGVESFDAVIEAQGINVSHVDWRPPAGGNPETAWALAALADDPRDGDGLGNVISRANDEAAQRLLDARPLLVDLVPANQIWPDASRRLLHAGPPISWDRVCGPMRGALIGATLFEGWAADQAGAIHLLERGEIRLESCHHAGAVGPMAGVISPSMSLWVVRNDAHGNVAYSNMNEGLGSVLRFGAFGPEVLERLRWMEDVLAPSLRRALASQPDGIDLKSLLAQALQMGDDGHNRNVAATSLLFRKLAVMMLSEQLGADEAAALRFIDSNNHFFLNLSMAAAKVALDAAHGVQYSSMVTAMARNGVDFGVRVSGLGDQWFTAPATVPEGLFFPGFSLADANPDMGDSAITETAGVGGFVMGTAPALVQFVGGTADDAVAYTREMMDITIARNPAYSLPALGFVGAPTGIDIRRVVDTGILPVINSGIAHREPGVGQVGAGIVRAPMACFEAALMGLNEQATKRPS